ncbi:MAG: isoprenylcysteine carboxylmethyltransferase family protein [Chloroflexi bacterium]|nr:isoprenylcysteine carboxylmethyltransferase family protein [Chloroflexota bacterium]
MSLARWIIFGAGSLLILTVSWKPLRDPRSHGFYRFFAWETILILFLVNMEVWFYKPFAWNQIIAWTLLFLSLVPLAFGVHSLRVHGNTTKQREGDPTLLAFEKTTALVTSGIFRYIRHPLYCSLLLLAWGIFFKSISLPGTILVFTATAFLIATARADERECLQFFGAPYAEYMKKTQMFIPYIL